MGTPVWNEPHREPTEGVQIEIATLRDQMAMAALPECQRMTCEAMKIGGISIDHVEESAAIGAYAHADAMLAARSAKGEK